MAAKVGVFTRSHNRFLRELTTSSKSGWAKTWKLVGNSNTEVKTPYGLGVSVFGYKAQIAAYNLFTVDC